MAGVTTLSDSVLIGLADGAWQSGESLAQAAGISRAAIHKRIQKLRDAGWPIEAEAGHGYRLPGGWDRLDAEPLQSRAPQAWQVTVLDETSGTNAWLAEQSYAGPHLVLAEQQTAGRGRRGRSWHSPPGLNLYASVDWQFDCASSQLGPLGLVVALSLAAAIDRPGVGIKWPNDLVVDGQKLAGILIEASGELAGPVRAIIGMGCNVWMREGPRLDQPWTSLARLGWRGCRTDLATALMQQLDGDLRRFSEQGFAPFLPRYQALDVLDGASVRVEQAGRIRMGRARGVDLGGRLQCEIDGQLVALASGEVSVRRQ